MVSNNNEKKYDYVDIVLWIAPFMTGLLSIWSLSLFGILCISGILYKVIRDKKIYFPSGKNIVFLLIYLFSFLIVQICAIDKGMNILAFFKNFTIFLFIVLCLQFSNSKRNIKSRLKVIPYSACLTVFISLLITANPDNTIFVNNRFQGIWNYANSYGLFLLVGLFILINKESLKKMDYVVLVILLLGIILTNSRAIIILSALTIIISIFMNKKNYKSILIILFCFILFFCGITFFTKMEKRLDKDMLESSEFVTRLLYYSDAIKLIRDNPFGLGYEGWYYKQTEIKTGVYDTKFVHNSILQSLLDVGIVPTISLLIMICISFFEKKQDLFSRVIMIIILGHSLIDIDLEYIYFIILLTFFVDFKGIELKNKYCKPICISACSIFTILYSLMFLSDVNYAMKNYGQAVSIIPFHTEAIQELLYSTTDKEEQLKYANDVLKYNTIVSGAYEALSNKLQEEERYEEALELEEKRLSYNKYSMYNYMTYANFLLKGINYFKNNNQDYEMDIFLKKLVEIEDMINNVIKNTNPLCYKTIHTPEIEINEDLKEVIEKAKVQLNYM